MKRLLHDKSKISSDAIEGLALGILQVAFRDAVMTAKAKWHPDPATRGVARRSVERINKDMSSGEREMMPHWMVDGAMDWFYETAEQPCSFSWCCTVLGLDPSRTRTTFRFFVKKELQDNGNGSKEGK